MMIAISLTPIIISTWVGFKTPFESQPLTMEPAICPAPVIVNVQVLEQHDNFDAGDVTAIQLQCHC